ncbi:hypothetical protein FN846DRAFT_972472 [Sphaerosporella brunnea]|uniref:Uncharacterized protein n=1 Tax=Sphaerosporella brunnea TaxID=1250544 RepID=A0A5J5EGI9_9PEZI|nr:hypothetical protein FN846DRAFT_972472 [Sphaerosporella brunnea]
MEMTAAAAFRPSLTATWQWGKETMVLLLLLLMTFWSRWQASIGARSCQNAKRNSRRWRVKRPPYWRNITVGNG